MRTRQAFLWAALAVLLCGSAPQETSTYIYDMHGRLVNAATAANAGNSNIANYLYDSADNRASHYSYPFSPRPSANTLAPGELLMAGQAVVSTDTQSRLELRSSGAVVISCNGVDQLTLTGANGVTGYLAMQTDGNLVLYSYLPTAIWATGTTGYPSSYLVLQDDGNAVIFSGSTPVWYSSTVC